MPGRTLADARKNQDGEWEKQGISEDYALRRYDAVIHMVTAADGARQFYKCGQVTDDSGHEVLRRETPDEAVALGPGNGAFPRGDSSTRVG